MDHNVTGEKAGGLAYPTKLVTQDQIALSPSRMGARTEDESDGSGLRKQRGKGVETIGDWQIACRIRQQNAKPAVVYAILE
jgi:hypothetical protein